MAEIIDGKMVSAHLREQMRTTVEALRARGITPGLAVVIVGEDPASCVYVRNKERACAEVGIYSEKHALPQETTQEELLALIETLNARSDINGILVQLPLPAQIKPEAVIAAIRPDKDVDAFHPVNVGCIMTGGYRFVPCTPAGVMELLKTTGVPIRGKDCVIVNDSNIVGKPMAMLLLHEHATVTVCHIDTRDLPEKTRRADILITAIGKPRFFGPEHVKDGAIVIDVGTSRDADGRLSGDVDFDRVAPKASFITPVPGGVGPMTITMLLKNTITAARQANGIADA